jgi:hypothetical protein
VTDFADFNEATPFIHAVDDAVITDSQPPFVFPAPHLLPAKAGRDYPATAQFLSAGAASIQASSAAVPSQLPDPTELPKSFNASSRTNSPASIRR